LEQLCRYILVDFTRLLKTLSESLCQAFHFGARHRGRWRLGSPDLLRLASLIKLLGDAAGEAGTLFLGNPPEQVPRGLWE
jgi:hypothetical protein